MTADEFRELCQREWLVARQQVKPPLTIGQQHALQGLSAWESEKKLRAQYALQTQLPSSANAQYGYDISGPGREQMRQANAEYEAMLQQQGANKPLMEQSQQEVSQGMVEGWRGLQDHWTALNKRRSELAVERLGRMQQGIAAAGGGSNGGGPVITPAQDSTDGSTSADKQSMDHMADQVIKGVLDGSVTRGKVRQIANATDTRQKSDERSDAVGRAIRFGGMG